MHPLTYDPLHVTSVQQLFVVVFACMYGECVNLCMSCVEDERDVIMDAARDMSTWSAETTRSSDITCCAYVHQGGLFIRANSVFGYCEANRQVSVSTVTFSSSRRPLLYVQTYV